MCRVIIYLNSCGFVEQRFLKVPTPANNAHTQDLES